jgi:hypothetical protein
MPRPIDPDALRPRALEVVAQMHQFNVSHPTPTFTEIEDAVDAALAGLRQDLLMQSLQGQALADFRGAPRAAGLSGLWRQRLGGWAGGAADRHAGRRGRDARADTGTLLSLWARAFPPWMSNSACYRDVSVRGCSRL